MLSACSQIVNFVWKLVWLELSKSQWIWWRTIQHSLRFYNLHYKSLNFTLPMVSYQTVHVQLCHTLLTCIVINWGNLSFILFILVTCFCVILSSSDSYEIIRWRLDLQIININTWCVLNLDYGHFTCSWRGDSKRGLKKALHSTPTTQNMWLQIMISWYP